MLTASSSISALPARHRRFRRRRRKSTLGSVITSIHHPTSSQQLSQPRISNLQTLTAQLKRINSSGQDQKICPTYQRTPRPLSPLYPTTVRPHHARYQI